MRFHLTLSHPFLRQCEPSTLTSPHTPRAPDPPPSRWPSAGLAPVCQCLFCTGEPKTGHRAPDRSRPSSKNIAFAWGVVRRIEKVWGEPRATFSLMASLHWVFQVIRALWQFVCELKQPGSTKDCFLKFCWSLFSPCSRQLHQPLLNYHGADLVVILSSLFLS